VRADLVDRDVGGPGLDVLLKGGAVTLGFRTAQDALRDVLLADRLGGLLEVASTPSDTDEPRAPVLADKKPGMDAAFVVRAECAADADDVLIPTSRGHDMAVQTSQSPPKQAPK